MNCVGASPAGPTLAGLLFKKQLKVRVVTCTILGNDGGCNSTFFFFFTILLRNRILKEAFREAG